MAVQKCCPDDSIYNCDFYQMMQNETNPCFDDAISLTSANVNSGLDPYFLYYTCRLDEPETMANYRSAAMWTHLRKIGMTEATVTCSSYDDFTNYLNRNDVRRALNIPSVVPKYESCSDEISNTYDLTVTHLISQQQNVKKLVDAQKKLNCNVAYFMWHYSTVMWIRSVTPYMVLNLHLISVSNSSNLNKSTRITIRNHQQLVSSRSTKKAESHDIKVQSFLT
ncbi:unnamed protein product [Nippostrongylus brasiliensis]|uniref:SCP domain-containing protein n=1 Tax=Nippostrongylus brasiliensis TaxID=27835 RepID=A0A0N4Y575_NIPBR|nr:unnamed protein product [Nippostrongylus brasiliensis]